MRRFTRWCALGMLALAYTACTDDEQQRAVPVVGPSMQVVSAGGNLKWTCDLTEYGIFDPDHGGTGLPCYLPSGGPQTDKDAVLYQGAGPTSAGSGVFGPIVRISTNNPTERGYNTSARPVQFDENTSGQHTVSLPLNALPVIYLEVPGYGEVAYREFNLDINQSASIPGLSLDEIYLFLSPDSAINSADPYACDFGQGSDTGLVWALDGDLDDGSGGDAGCLDADFEDQWVLLNYKLESGSGAQDMKLLVPDFYFELAEVGGIDQCPYDGGTGRCGLWLYFYSHFGGAVEPIGEFIDWPPPGGKSDKYNSAEDLTSVINNANF